MGGWWEELKMCTTVTYMPVGYLEICLESPGSRDQLKTCCVMAWLNFLTDQLTVLINGCPASGQGLQGHAFIFRLPSCIP